jgi:hypothetical protein
MTLSNAVMLVAGIMVLLSVALTKYVSYDFYILLLLLVYDGAISFHWILPCWKNLKITRY